MSQESSRGPWTLRIPNTLGSQGVCFVLLDMCLSQLMPNTRQLDRFFPHGTKVTKQPYLLTKVILIKFGEEIEHMYCFAMCKISIKTVKYKVILSHLVQNNFLSRPLHFLQ